MTVVPIADAWRLVSTGCRQPPHQGILFCGVELHAAPLTRLAVALGRLSWLCKGAGGLLLYDGEGR